MVVSYVFILASMDDTNHSFSISRDTTAWTLCCLQVLIHLCPMLLILPQKDIYYQRRNLLVVEIIPVECIRMLQVVMGVVENGKGVCTKILIQT